MSYKQRRSTIPWLRSSGYGTIYLMQSVNDPGLFKVGFTQRRTSTRRAELEEVSDGKLKIVYTLSMPHAYQVEQRVLKGLRKRFWARQDCRGTEWFRLRPWESLESIKRRMDTASLRVRFIAVWKLSWPIMGEIRVFNPMKGRNRENGPGRMSKFFRGSLQGAS